MSLALSGRQTAFNGGEFPEARAILELIIDKVEYRTAQSGHSLEALNKLVVILQTTGIFQLQLLGQSRRWI